MMFVYDTLSFIRADKRARAHTHTHQKFSSVRVDAPAAAK
jgi:hypothetical protein